ncbi:MAG: hypothetical protein ACI8W8_001647 [Rhodothermales bacterium]|jgi:hypothetical protein
MKWLLITLLALPLFAQDAMRAKLELIDGSLMAGDLQSPRLSLQAGYATLNLDFSHIQRVDRRANGGYDLRIRNGDRLTGPAGLRKSQSSPFSASSPCP